MKAGLPLAVSAALLSACAASPGAAPTPRPAAAPTVDGIAVSRDGMGFVVDLRPGVPGAVLTPQGAIPVVGRTILVRRNGAALAMDEGRLAKDVAAEGCAAAGGRFDGRAVGAFAGGGTWAFEGACA